MATILTGNQLPPRGAICVVCGKNTEQHNIAYEILSNGGRQYYHEDCYEWILTAGQKEVIRHLEHETKVLGKSFNDALSSWMKEK